MMDEKERNERASNEQQSQNVLATMASFYTWFIMAIDTPDTLLSPVHISFYATFLSLHSQLFGVW